VILKSLKVNKLRIYFDIEIIKIICFFKFLDFYEKIIEPMKILISEELKNDQYLKMKNILINKKRQSLLINKEIIIYLLLIIREDLIKATLKQFLKNKLIKSICEFFTFLRGLDELKDNFSDIQEMKQIFLKLEKCTYYTNLNEYLLLKECKF